MPNSITFPFFRTNIYVFVDMPLLPSDSVETTSHSSTQTSFQQSPDTPPQKDQNEQMYKISRDPQNVQGGETPILWINDFVSRIL